MIFQDDTNPIFLIDFYKFGHVDQYPKNISKVFEDSALLVDENFEVIRKRVRDQA